MTQEPAHDRLARLLEYPGDDLPERVSDAARALAAACPEARGTLDALAAHAVRASRAECEEAYIATFELSPLCALEIGWQLYGDRYARGAFLVRMRQLMRDTGLPETSELPDHLGHVLRVAARTDAETAAKLAHKFALPALATMRERFAGKGNPYDGVLAAAEMLLARHVAQPAGAGAGGEQ